MIMNRLNYRVTVIVGWSTRKKFKTFRNLDKQMAATCVKTWREDPYTQTIIVKKSDIVNHRLKRYEHKIIVDQEPPSPPPTYWNHWTWNWLGYNRQQRRVDDRDRVKRFLNKKSQEQEMLHGTFGEVVAPNGKVYSWSTQRGEWIRNKQKEHQPPEPFGVAERVLTVISES